MSFQNKNITFKNIKNWINRPCFIHQFSSFALKLCFIRCSKDVSLTRLPKDEVEKYIFHLWSPKGLKCEYSMNICEPSLYPHNLKLMSILIKPFVTSFIEDLVFVHYVKHKKTHTSQFHNTFFWSYYSGSCHKYIFSRWAPTLWPLLLSISFFKGWKTLKGWLFAFSWLYTHKSSFNHFSYIKRKTTKILWLFRQIDGLWNFSLEKTVIFFLDFILFPKQNILFERDYYITKKTKLFARK